MSRIRLAVYFGREDCKLGPGKVRLLEEVRARGSISAAARSLGMAYRHAWEMIDDLNRCFAKPVVTASTGGRVGGGARVTELGNELIERFHAMERAAETALRNDVRALDGKLRASSETRTRRAAPAKQAPNARRR
jgi:molybdate transport system regulatory protein